MAIVGECKGGLCNRILPLATYLEIPQATGLQIKLRWKPDANCQAEFSDLFQNSFDINGKIPKGVFRMSTPELRPNHAAYSIEQLITEHETRGFVALTLVHPDPKIQNLNHIRSLRPTPALQEKILQATQALQLDRSVIGVHARCTDRRDFHYYKRQITENVDPSQRVFICSDEAEVEDRLKKEFGDRIVSYKKSRYVEKIDPHAKWHHNLIRSKESVQEALVDLYLLAKTDIQIYDEKSTFATCAKILGDERHALQHRK